MQNNILQYLRLNGWLWLNAIWFLIGIFWLRWRAEVVIFAYIFETIIIGIIILIKMVAICIWGEKQKEQMGSSILKNFGNKELKTNSRKILLILYQIFLLLMFSLIFFGFIWGQSVFMFLILSQSDTNISDAPNMLIDNFYYMFSQTDIRQAFIGIIISNILLMLQHFILERQYLRTTLEQLFEQPWTRIFIQQIIVIAGGLIYFILDYGFVGIAVLLILVKTIIESYLNQQQNTLQKTDYQIETNITSKYKDEK